MWSAFSLVKFLQKKTAIFYNLVTIKVQMPPRPIKNFAVCTTDALSKEMTQK